ncbi:MAG: bis(5'-nucleosyl)-tetraphosphatase (symmetrical) YqeK [Ruminococcus sp.]|nr:bis(5'-nucleosyl)-tetraphosphatase (symmetrical) YqeK [Ruminococcus sp.]
MNKAEYLSLINERMGERRYIHSVNVAKSAVELARHYGADVEKAEIAGILHDCCKEIPRDEMLQIMTDGGIILDAVEKGTSKLWHAIAGSVFVRDNLKINDDDIINAIRYHTTGRAGMSLLEKVIFIADFISDERDYKGVEIMRKKAFNCLEDAMLFGLQFTITDLTARKLTIHTNALACYNDIIFTLEQKGLL